MTTANAREITCPHCHGADHEDGMDICQLCFGAKVIQVRRAVVDRGRVRVVFSIAIAGGLLVGALISVGMLARCQEEHAVDLTRAKQAELVRINLEVNSRYPRRWPDGRGLCALIAAQKRARFIMAGVPAWALSFRDVWAERAHEGHRLLLINARVEGRPWKVAFDMNSPWPLDDRQQAAWGYRPLEAR